MATEARNLIAETKSAHAAVNVTDQLEQQRQGEIQMKLVSCEKKLEQSSRQPDDIVGQHELQANERRSSAVHKSKQVEKLCNHLKDPNMSVQNKL